MRRRASPPSAAEPVRIARIGADGDGIAEGPEPLYIAGTLPDETVLVRPPVRRGDGRAGEIETILAPSAERVAPPCLHFGACGGCALQHWADGAYAAWKSSLLAAALARAGYADAVLAPLARTAPGARRRMDVAVRRTSAGVVVGLHRPRSTEITDLLVCPVLHPTLATLIGALRSALPGLSLLRSQGSAIANLLDTGPDLLLRTDAAPSARDRAMLADFARANGIARICWGLRDGPPEPVAQLRPATIALSGVTVAPPPGAFLQASAAGEAAIVAAVRAGLPERARVAELYAGIGTLTFALAPHHRLAAWEGDAAALAALRAAGPVTAALRDLARQPLTAKELAGFGAVVLDPPHAGAAAQIGQIAASGVTRVVYVGCNPATLARDARSLREAGYRLLYATPIDQFLWSARLEFVCVFAR